MSAPGVSDYIPASGKDLPRLMHIRMRDGWYYHAAEVVRGGTRSLALVTLWKSGKEKRPPQVSSEQAGSFTSETTLGEAAERLRRVMEDYKSKRRARGGDPGGGDPSGGGSSGGGGTTFSVSDGAAPETGGAPFSGNDAAPSREARKGENAKRPFGVGERDGGKSPARPMKDVQGRVSPEAGPIPTGPGQAEGADIHDGDGGNRAKGKGLYEGARLGHATSKNYRSIFFKVWPELRGKVVVHHAIERNVLKRYAGTITEAQMHSLENLRGSPKELNSDLHLSEIRKSWNQFYLENPEASLQKLLDHATKIDEQFGHLFRPPI